MAVKAGFNLWASLAWLTHGVRDRQGTLTEQGRDKDANDVKSLHIIVQGCVIACGSIHEGRHKSFSFPCTYLVFQLQTSYQTHTWSIAFSSLLNLLSSYLLATTIATMGIGGAVLKFGSTALYALEFCCAAVILGIYSYFLAVQADRDVNIPVWQQAVTGLAGATVLYTIFAVLLTCCLGGKVRTCSIDI